MQLLSKESAIQNNGALQHKQQKVKQVLTALLCHLEEKKALKRMVFDQQRKEKKIENGEELPKKLLKKDHDQKRGGDCAHYYAPAYLLEQIILAKQFCSSNDQTNFSMRKSMMADILRSLLNTTHHLSVCESRQTFTQILSNALCLFSNERVDMQAQIFPRCFEELTLAETFLQDLI